MASSRVLIASQTLGSSAASVTFSSIPSTYKDLILKMSIRTTAAGNYDVALIRFNSSATSYSGTWVSGTNGTAASNRLTGGTYQYAFSVVGSGATANTFSNQEIYIPSYTASQNKPSGNFGASENNSTDAQIGAYAGLWSNTAAISQINIFATNLAAGSSFYLYGLSS